MQVSTVTKNVRHAKFRESIAFGHQRHSASMVLLQPWCGPNALLVEGRAGIEKTTVRVSHSRKHPRGLDQSRIEAKAIARRQRLAISQGFEQRIVIYGFA